METLAIAAEFSSDIRQSIYFMIAHATNVAFHTRTNNPQSTLFKSILSTIVAGFGGTMMTCIILGEPFSFLFNPFVLPVYSAATFSMYFLQPIIASQNRIFKPVSAAITAFASGANMVSKMFNLTGTIGLAAIAPNIFIGIIAACGGSLSHTWFVKGNLFSISDPFVKIVTFTAVIIKLLMELENSHELKTMIRDTFGINLLLNFHEFQFIAGLMIYIGLLINLTTNKKNSRMGNVDDSKEAFTTDSETKPPKRPNRESRKSKLE
jgi:hypothetical protein